MKLEFKVYKIKEGSSMHKLLVEDANKPNEFIIVGEENVSDDYNCFKVEQLYEDGIHLIGGMKIGKCSCYVKKTDLINKCEIGYETTELDIPKEYLTMTIIENIQRLNE